MGKSHQAGWVDTRDAANDLHWRHVEIGAFLSPLFNDLVYSILFAAGSCD
jgi:hypothetical protein